MYNIFALSVFILVSSCTFFASEEKKVTPEKATNHLFKVIKEHKKIHHSLLQKKYIANGADINAVQEGITPFALALRHGQYITAYNLAACDADIDTPVDDIGGIVKQATPYHMVALLSQEKPHTMHVHLSMIILLALSKADPRISDNNKENCSAYAHSAAQPFLKELIRICSKKNGVGLPKKILTMYWHSNKQHLADNLHIFNIALQTKNTPVIAFFVKHFYKDIQEQSSHIPETTDCFFDKQYTFMMKKAWDNALKKYMPNK